MEDSIRGNIAAMNAPIGLSSLPGGNLSHTAINALNTMAVFTPSKDTS
jgi:hypothetical protein